MMQGRTGRRPEMRMITMAAEISVTHRGGSECMKFHAPATWTRTWRRRGGRIGGAADPTAGGTDPRQGGGARVGGGGQRL